MLLLLITALSAKTFLLNFINFCRFVQRLYNKNQGGPAIMLHCVKAKVVVVIVMLVMCPDSVHSDF